MKIYSKLMLPVALLFTLTVNAQTKKVTAKKTSSSNKVSIKAVDRNFGTSTSIADITDVIETDVAYSAVKNLIENYGVTLTYADNTFRGKEPLKRGDFIVALNSALNNLRSQIDAGNVTDTTLFNTYDRNRNGSYLTSISQVKDLSKTSIYYPAAQSLIEKWGIAAPFGMNKSLNANSAVPEKEVYEILKAVMGYTSPGVNPYATAMTRSKFAVVLNNAVTQKMTQISTIRTAQQLVRDDERRRQMDSLKRVDMLRRDAVAKEIQLRKLEAAQKEEEARKALQKKKR